MIQVYCPIYVMLAPVSCWKCGATTTVAGIAATAVVDDDDSIHDSPSDQVGDVVALQNITDMPHDVLEANRAFQPRHIKHKSRTAGHAFYQNLCACGTNFGDFFLWKFAGPFFPMTVDHGTAVRVVRVPLVGTQEFDADDSQGGLDLNFGGRCPQKPDAKPLNDSSLGH